MKIFIFLCLYSGLKYYLEDFPMKKIDLMIKSTINPLLKEEIHLNNKMDQIAHAQDIRITENT